MDVLREPERYLPEVKGVRGGFPVTQLCLFSPQVISAEMSGWWLNNRYESTSAGATPGQPPLAEGQDR